MLAESIPAPTSVSVVPTTEDVHDACWTTRHLQPQPTPFLDRTVETERIQRLLLQANARLVTLAGPAGVGKTRLAREIGVRLSGSFPHGVVFVDLTPTRDAQLVPARIAHCLGLTNIGGEAVLEQLKEYLQERRVLLILDNFEHVLPAAVRVAELLGALPSLTVLVTSRVPLRLRWERTVRIFPLPVPDKEATTTIDELIEIPSVALFVERAQSRRADFLPTEQNVKPLIHLIRQLDGLPLAIELAAANMSALPLSAIARRMDRQLQILRWDAQDLPDRHRSLQAAIEWSYELLPPSEQRLFRHLGVFVGRVSLDAIAAVVGEGDEERTLDGLVALADMSLVLPRVGEDDDTEPAFGMLETVRQYAAEHLQTQGEFDSAGRAHAHYFLKLAEQADPELRRRDQLVWHARLEAEHDNLRAALRWLLDHDEYEAALRLAGALGYFWFRRGYHSEGWRWLEEALEKAPRAEPSVRSRALMMAGWLLTLSGDMERSRALLEEALSLAREAGNRTAVTRSICYLGVHAAYAGDVAESQRLLDEALGRAREMQDDHLIAVALFFLSNLSRRQGEHREAIALVSEALARNEAAGNLFSTIIVRFTLALQLQQVGDLPGAVASLQDGLRASRAFKDRWQLSLGLKATFLIVGERAPADRRARLLGAVDALVQSTGMLPGTPDLMLGQGVTCARAQPDQTELRDAYDEGRALPFTEVIDLALEMLEELSRALTATAPAPKELSPQGVLSGREREVLRLVAEGLTSKQIGQQLFLSHRTVDHHLTSVFNKLGVDSRSQAVAVAAREGFV